MSHTELPRRFDAEAYLAWEARQNERHEFYRGEVFLKSGGTLNHNLVGGNAVWALRGKLKGTPCRVLAFDMRVEVVPGHAYFYPDVVVHCARTAADGQSSLLKNPILVIEVLSDSTSSWDRGGKFAAYRELASLKEYVLIDPTAQTVEVYRRNAANRFELYAWDHQHGGLCEFASVGSQWPLEAVFEGVEIDADTPSNAAVAHAGATS